MYPLRPAGLSNGRRAFKIGRLGASLLSLLLALGLFVGLSALASLALRRLHHAPPAEAADERDYSNGGLR